MAETIPLARPSIGDAERSAAQRVLSGTQLTSGPELKRFEALLAETSGRSHAIAMSSGTSALELALWAIGVGPGDAVLVTAFGFPAAANAVAARGATPVAVDVHEQSWLMDFEAAARAANSSTKAIVTIDQLGAVTSSREIDSLQLRTSLPVLSDAACGLGGTDADGRPGGVAGRMATFSFHPRKLITTGEGGAVVCDDEELAIRLRELRNHGQVGNGRFAGIGTNARLDECGAAIGCAQLARLAPMLTERRMLVDGYHQRLEHLRESGKLRWQVLADGSQHANQSFSIVLEKRLGRDAVVGALQAKGIGCGVATYSFAEIGIHKEAGLAPVAKSLHEGALSLPLYIGMRSAELDRVCDALAEVLS
ncbi:MAG: DegT/DnrJ/EryC1/StrS aminotransferase family protein [Myxococcales bacterium]|nr:DegT/DnrJ/EryC1/StrS aminotransferase family protein [Myxococcales bacterium]